MHSWQYPFLGLRQFPPELTEFEIHYFFGCSRDELAAINTRRGDLHRIAAAVHMGFIKMTGRTLDAFDRIPPSVLSFVGEQLNVSAPELSTLRALYRWEATLFEHQSWAAKQLGFSAYGERRQRVLLTQLRREADKAVVFPELLRYAQRWLYDKKILLPSRRRLARVVGRVAREIDRATLAKIQEIVPENIRRQWVKAVLERHPADQAYLEWLQTPPGTRTETTLLDTLEKFHWLQALGIDQYDLSSIRLIRQRHYARKIRQRPPARFRSISEPRRGVELVCFLHVTLMQVADTIVSLVEMKTLDIQRVAINRAREQLASTLPDSRSLLRRIRQMLEDHALNDGQLRGQLLELVPTMAALSQSRAARVRYLLSEPRSPVRRLLKHFLVLDFKSDRQDLLDAVDYVRAAYVLRQQTLPDEIDIGFAPRWRELLQGRDRRRALRAFEAAVLLELRKGLQNGSVWIPCSLAYRKRDQILMSSADWETQRDRYFQQFSIRKHPGDYVQRLLAHVEVGLNVVAKEVESGRIEIDDKGLHLKALEAEEEPPTVSATRRALLKEIGVIQFPDLIVEIDTHTRFSWRLLGHEPKTAREILALYGALLADGTALTPSEVALMMSEISAQDITDAMRLLEDRQVLREANNLVVDFMHRHPIVQYWGDGTIASSDAMSLDASRHLWNARLDPKRRVRGIGMYTHVLDQWGIIYDQPILLGLRQAGAAIEGAVKQTITDDLAYLAVDGHGYTDFALAVAKLLGFDLCPRLKNLKERRFHVPSDVAVPEALRSITVRDVSRNHIERGWDQFVRVVASIDSGVTAATLALQRFGAASRADPIHKAGTALGKILLTLFLCDLITNPDFRRTLWRNLSHGESVHSLQRLIYNGGISALHGRHVDALCAISGSLTLLTNIVMAWNTHRMQQVYDHWTTSAGKPVDPENIRSIAPVHSHGINFRGEYHFAIDKHRDRLMPNRSTMI